MSQYLLSVHYVEGVGATPEAEMQEAFEATDRFNNELQAEGAWVFAGGLHTPDMATVVDATGAETITTDGPFSEAKEQIGGFWVVEAPDLDAALALAARGFAACRAKVEVRPFHDGPEDVEGLKA
ncbi:YciI family protein [Aquihabitans daechungensis]|uniref:YciI family protein n=1 Tax=Aquihabitans daechungensis TaxID=1052257 RepID=UPI003BA39A16